MNQTDWLNEMVCWDQMESMPRRVTIRRFCVHGLISVVTAYGYTVDTTIVPRIAKGLYKNRGKTTFDSDWSFSPIVNSSPQTEDYKSHYYHVLDQDIWSQFWNRWGLWSDLTWDRKNDIEEYCWTQINLENSPQMQAVYSLMGLEDDIHPDERDGKDVYLKEAAESNEWGGYRR